MLTSNILQHFPQLMFCTLCHRLNEVGNYVYIIKLQLRWQKLEWLWNIFKCLQLLRGESGLRALFLPNAQLPLDTGTRDFSYKQKSSSTWILWTRFHIVSYVINCVILVACLKWAFKILYQYNDFNSRHFLTSPAPTMQQFKGINKLSLELVQDFLRLELWLKFWSKKII